MLAPGLAVESETVGVVHDAVEDGIGEGGLIDDLTPRADRELTGDQGRGVGVAVLEDLQQVAALIRAEPVRTPVVEDQGVGPGEGAEEADIPAPPKRCQGSRRSDHPAVSIRFVSDWSRCLGIAGRVPSVRVVAINRNRWLRCLGARTRALGNRRRRLACPYEAQSEHIGAAEAADTRHRPNG